jgi:CheY-like chemotaxis protein
MTVCVVDDVRDAADSLALVLHVLGHRAFACYDASQALAHIGAQKPDCVMLDIAMQGMDGLELARQIRKKFGDDIVLVAITGMAVDDLRVKATFETVDHYFEKPVTLQQIQKLFPPID